MLIFEHVLLLMPSLWCNYVDCWYVKQQGNHIPTTICLIKQLCSYFHTIYALVPIFNPYYVDITFGGLWCLQPHRSVSNHPRIHRSAQTPHRPSLHVGIVARTHFFTCIVHHTIGNVVGLQMCESQSDRTTYHLLAYLEWQRASMWQCQLVSDERDQLVKPHHTGVGHTP
jgi:hypothetical protein